MANLYITGDSFCFWRKDPLYHWPLILANNLNLKLTGEGYPGRSWWNSRQNLHEYKQTPDFQNTELFIFCHTEPLRILSTEIASYSPDRIPDELHAKQIYYKHIYDEDFHRWAMVKYYHELNEILENKKVIHLFCFRAALNLGFTICNGYKGVDALTRLVFADFKSKNKDINTEQSYNHFLPETNIELASFFTNLFNEQIKDNLPTTKNFNITLDQ